MTLINRILQIKNETISGANTATRVGGLLEDLFNYLDKAFNNYFDITSQSVTTIASSNTWYKLNTTTTEGLRRNGLVHSNNRVTWTGSATTVFKIDGIVSLQSGNNNQIHVAFFKNEILHPCSEQEFTTSGTGRSTNVAFQCLIELQQNQFVEVFVKNATGTTNITLDNLNVIVQEL